MVGKGPSEDVAVVLTSLPASVSRVAVVKLLMVHAGLEPGEAMERVQGLTDRKGLEVAVPSRESARSLLAGLEALGAQAQVRLPAVRGPRPLPGTPG
jgi:hypothetical protein